ncbi:MAG: SH3 domain-containing protein, partial [Campylobacterota bacterium]
LVIIFLSGCSTKTGDDYILQDLHNYSQNIDDYSFDYTVDAAFMQAKQKEFYKRYFMPWNSPSVSYNIAEAMWGRIYLQSDTYGANLKPLTQKFYDHQLKNANYKAYGSVNKKAIAISNTHMRVFPTQQPIFKDPKKAGEGYPFDYNQNSLLKINSPLLISHYSLDGAWALVQSSFALGWVRSNDIAILTKKQIQKIQKQPLYVAFADNAPIYSNNAFVEYLKIGTIVSSDTKGRYLFDRAGNKRYIDAGAKAIRLWPIAMREENIHKVASQLMEEPYGWGGALGLRDCSAMMRDFFAVFGIYLPRNSSKQVLQGKSIDISKMDAKEKKRVIIDRAKPFRTLLYMKGHVMLYIGHQDAQPLFMHSFWGIRTKNNGSEGRFIVGKTAITSLEAGSERDDFDATNSLLRKAIAIVTFV